jgi:hypothetical protein
VSAYCEVNSKLGCELGFNSIYACQAAPNCGHYWIHSDGTRVKDSSYDYCRQFVLPDRASYNTSQTGHPNVGISNPNTPPPPLSTITQNLEQYKETCSPGNDSRETQHFVLLHNIVNMVL